VSSEQASVVLADTTERMRKAVTHAKSEFSSVRTGRASPALVEKLQVNAYGQEMPLQQLAGFQVPEARMLLITPYDRATLGAIEKAIMNSDLGLNPSNDGNSIRLVFPPLTQERRKELVKRVKHMAEEGKVAVRNARRDARKHLDQMERDGAITSDEHTRAEKELDRLTHEQEAGIDKALSEKEQELLDV
jgi:ribosome recycling factor